MNSNAVSTLMPFLPPTRKLKLASFLPALSRQFSETRGFSRRCNAVSNLSSSPGAILSTSSQDWLGVSKRRMTRTKQTARKQRRALITCVNENTRGTISQHPHPPPPPTNQLHRSAPLRSTPHRSATRHARPHSNTTPAQTLPCPVLGSALCPIKPGPRPWPSLTPCAWPAGCFVIPNEPKGILGLVLTGMCPRGREWDHNKSLKSNCIP